MRPLVHAIAMAIVIAAAIAFPKPATCTACGQADCWSPAHCWQGCVCVSINGINGKCFPGKTR